MSIRPGSKVSPGRSMCLTWSVNFTERASAIDVIRPLSSMKMAGCSTYRPARTSSIRSAVTTVVAYSGEANEIAAAAASKMRFIARIAPRLDVDHAPEGGEHAFVHHFRQG